MKVLALSPHTDDIELGAGGFLQFVEGCIRVIAFSTGNPESGATKQEFAASMESLKIGDHECLDFTTRLFPAQRQEVLDRMVWEHRKYTPDLVLVPASTDCHQDHQVVHDEAIRAFRRCSILGYELPWNNPTGFKSQFYVPLSMYGIRGKIAALEKYTSQWGIRSSVNADAIRSLARIRGMQIGNQYAEAFEVIRWIWNVPDIRDKVLS